MKQSLSNFPLSVSHIMVIHVPEHTKFVWIGGKDLSLSLSHTYRDTNLYLQVCPVDLCYHLYQVHQGNPLDPSHLCHLVDLASLEAQQVLAHLADQVVLVHPTSGNNRHCKSNWCLPTAPYISINSDNPHFY